MKWCWENVSLRTRKLTVSQECMVIFFFVWFVLQVGNARPEIQKVVDALNSIQTKVIFAVCVD